MTDPVPKPLPERVRPVIDLPLHKPKTPTAGNPPEEALADSSPADTTTQPDQPSERERLLRPPILPPPVIPVPPTAGPTPTATDPGGPAAGTFNALLAQMAALAEPFSDLAKLASEQAGLSAGQKPDPMPDGSPAYGSPILTGSGVDVVGIVASVLAQRDAFNAVLEKMSSLTGYGPDNLPDDSITADELRALPLDELASVVDIASRIVAGWATGSAETSPTVFVNTMAQLSDNLRQMAVGEPAPDT